MVSSPYFLNFILVSIYFFSKILIINFKIRQFLNSGEAESQATGQTLLNEVKEMSSKSSEPNVRNNLYPPVDIKIW
jgi:hypothetical protein